MANADHLILGIGVGAIVATIVVGAVLLEPVPPVPEDPFAHISFFAQRSAYALGERATFVIANSGPLTFDFWGWSIWRMVGEEEFVGAACLAFTTDMQSVRPFDQYVFDWTILPPSPDCAAGLEHLFGPLPPFGPGVFAASVHLFGPEEGSVPRQLLAEFNVV